MAPQQPTHPPSPASGVQVVTLTLYSTGSSGSTGLPTSSGGGSSMPVGAIAGGAAGGVALAVSMVLIWKYWGLVIKRTEKRRHKEAEDRLTVRENTRRNAATRFKPHAPLRPILSLNPEGRRVKFLARTPTSPRGKNATTTAAAIPPPTEEEKCTAQEAPAPAADPGTDSDGPRQQPSPSFASAAAPLLARDPADPEQKSEGAEQPPEEEEAEATSPPHPPARAPSPIASRSPSGRSHSPTPSRAASDRPSSSKPSRSMRMRTPRRLPDPPAAPPVPVRSAQGHSTRPSSSTPSRSRTSVSPSPLPAATPRRAETSPGTPPTSTSSAPAVASGSAIAGPSRSGSGSGSRSPSPPPIPLPALTWASSPLYNSVLPSERPVIMPRAKSASATSPSESQPTSPTSTGGHVPALTSSASRASAGSGEAAARRGFLDSLRRIRPSAETAGENARRVSIQSTPSVYSND